MRGANFFKKSWVFQLIVGVGLFFCSFAVEYQVIKSFISPALFAFFLTITLEAGKVSAIIWHYYMDYLSPNSYPASVRLVSVLFRLGLVILSLTCSQLFLNARLDRPYLSRIKSSGKAAVQRQLDSKLSEIDRYFNEAKEALQHHYQGQIVDIQKQYDKRIVQLESLLLAEMDNVVGGVFKGPRYHELERRLEKEKTARHQALESLQQSMAEQLASQIKRYNMDREDARAKAKRSMAKIVADDYFDDERVNDPHIVALVKVAQSLFDIKVHPMQFVFLFSFLLSLLMEVGIILSFATITVCMAPALRVQHEETLEQESLRARIHGKATREKARHDAAMDRIAKSGRRVVERAQAHARRGLSSDAVEGVG